MSEKTENTPSSPAGAEPALLVDVRGAFDRGWWKSRTSEELAHLDAERAAACSALMVLLPILGSSRLDESYRRALFAWDGGFHKTDKPRPPKPDGFERDLAYFRQVLPVLVGGAHYTAPDSEADDVISTASVKAREAGYRSCVVSGDKDLQQLACRAVTYYCLNKKSILSPQHIMDRFDLRHPSHLAVWLAVVGDPGDGVNGVDGWAEGAWKKKVMKAAPADLTMEGLIALVESVIPPKQVQNFFASLDATLLRHDVPNVPEPTPLNAATLDFLMEEGLAPVRSNFARFRGDLATAGAAGEDAASAVDRDY